MQARSPSLSVIVPATDSPLTIDRCRAAIEQQLSAADELIVVASCRAPGPAAARNEGARRARGDVLVFIDADVVAHRDALARVRAGFAVDPGMIAVFGSYDDRPEAPGAVSRFRNLLHHHVHATSAGAVASFWAGLGAVDAAAFARSGGFDAAGYPRPAIEDVELGRRLAATGGRIVCDPTIQGTHLKRWTLASMVRTDLLQRGAPWVELLLRRRREGLPADQLNLGLGHRIAALGALALVSGAALRRPRVALGGLGALVLSERALYGLLARRLPAGHLPIAVAAHVVHLLTAVAALPAGVARTLGRIRS